MGVISREIKEQILGRLKQGGVTVKEVSEQHGISTKTIYYWLRKGLYGSDKSLLEVNQLRKENKQLRELVGKLLLQIERGKKN